MGRLLVILASFLSASITLFSRTFEAEGWAVLPVCGARGLVGVLILGALLRKQIFDVPRAARGSLVVICLSFTLGAPLMFFANRHAPAGLVTSIIYLAPVWVVAYDWLRGNRQTRSLVALAFGLTGVCLSGWQPGNAVRSTVQWLGLGATLVDSLFLAAFLVANKKATAMGANPLVVGFWGLLLPALLFGGQTIEMPWSPKITILTLGMGVATGALYMWAISAGLARLKSATEGGMLQYTEVAFAWSIGIAIYHEAVT